MDIIPAIDIKDGEVVRLYKGDANLKTIYGRNYMEIARSYFDLGIKIVHVVDLNRALGIGGDNEPIIMDILEAFPLCIQVGGGIRDSHVIKKFLDHGAMHVVVGTLAFKNPELIFKIAKTYPGRISIALDCKGRELVSQGWIFKESIGLKGALNLFLKEHALGPYLVTQVIRDGTLEGPDIDLVSQVVDMGAKEVIISGGIASLEDLKIIKGLSCPEIFGVIIGKALYEGKINLKNALRLFR